MERIGAQLVQVESEMTDLMERHSKEVDALMASSKSREDDHLKVPGSVLNSTVFGRRWGVHIL